MLKTEMRNNLSLDIDKLSTKDILLRINNEDREVPIKVSEEIEDIEKAVDLVVDVLQKGGRIIYMGAGTSGRLAILDSAECPPTYGTDPAKIVALIAGGEKAFTSAVENSEDSREQSQKDLEKINLSQKDLVIGIAASGKTPYVIEGLDLARKTGAKTIAISCNKGTQISALADVAIEIDTGSEIIMGSTRMKAGTAQKLILNMLTTTAMIKLGNVYSNLMVNVGSFNKKLVERQKIIVMEATGCSLEEAEESLRDTNKDCKLSIFSILSEKTLEEARGILQDCKGNIREALKNL